MIRGFGSAGLLLLHAVATLAAPGLPNNEKRLVDTTREGATSSLLSIANSFTSASNSTATITSSASVAMQTGRFTAADGGVYYVTSQSGYVVVDGKSMGPGQGALIGNERVSEGSSGFMANGVTILLTPVAEVAASTTSTATVASSSSMATTSLAATASALSSASQAASSAASASSTAAAGAPTQYAGNVGWVAAAGGVLGLLVL